MSHLETLIAEYLELQGYLIKRNTKMGKLGHGGWSMELDVVGYHPGQNVIKHYEPSVDAHKWAVREQRYQRKFEDGRRYILQDMFPWLPASTPLKQYAIFPSRSRDRTHVAGGEVMTIDELMTEIRGFVRQRGAVCRNAIPEQYPLLRTIQLDTNGYVRRRDEMVQRA